MTTYAILNGVHVDASLINPKEHVFLGMFRPAINPFANPTCDILCRCGEMLRYKGQEREHYLKGCFDVPQYGTIHKQDYLTQDAQRAGYSQYAGYCSGCGIIFKIGDPLYECDRSSCSMAVPFVKHVCQENS